MGVFGQRQVGKTTITTSLSPEYVTLDLQSNLAICDANPMAFLQNRKYPFAIDECQLSPALFPALKESVRLLTKPGRFLITGSVRFTSRKMIRESLTGRIAMHELLPMNITEAHSEALNELPSKTIEALKSKSPEKIKSFLNRLAKQRKLQTWHKRVADFLTSGGLPGVCFSHNSDLRHKKWESYLETILLRDLQLIIQTTLSYTSLRNLLVQIALRQGEALELNELARLTGISALTTKKILLALDGLFLIRELPTLGSTAKSTYYLEDQGLAYHLVAGWKNTHFDLFRLLFANVRQQFTYRGDVRFLHYKTRGGAFLPLVCQTTKGMIAYTACEESEPIVQTLRSAESFLKAYPQACVFIGHKGSEIRMWHTKLWSMPVGLIL